MSNISKTSAAIKKKLSFGDYRRPVGRPKSKPADQQASKKVVQRAGKTVVKQVGRPVGRPKSKPTQQQAVIPAVQPVVVPVSQQVKTLKTKATYYLGKSELEMLTQLYIKQLQQHNKADRSAIVCQAIRLIYERDTCGK